MQREKLLAIRLSNWMRRNHRDMIFRFDIGADVKTTIGQARQNSSLNYITKFPDLFVAEPTKQFAGLYLELKARREDLYRKDGTLKRNKHVIGQHKMLMLLRKKGYQAHFAVGLDDATLKITQYLETK